MRDGQSGIDLGIDYDAHFAYGRAFPDPSQDECRQAFLKYAPALARNLAMAQLMRRLFAHPGAPAPGNTDFASSGSQRFAVAPQDWGEFAEALAPARAALEQRLAAIAPEQRKRRDELMILDESFKGVRAALERLLNDAGVIGAARAYLGDDVVVTSPALLFSEQHAKYLRNRFVDHQREDSPLNYLHIDTNIHTIKLMVYLDPVSDNEGPFCYVPRDRYQMSLTNQAIRKANDQSGLQAASHANIRRQFAALPPLYRQKAAIGDDVLGDDPRVPAWLSAERRYTSDCPTIIAFDGDHGFHRGNLIQRGERKVLNVSLLSKSYLEAYAALGELAIGFGESELERLIALGALPREEGELELESFSAHWFERRLAPRVEARKSARMAARRAAEARHGADKLRRAAGATEAAEGLGGHRAGRLRRAADEAETAAVAAEAESSRAQTLASTLDAELGVEPAPAS